MVKNVPGADLIISKKLAGSLASDYLDFVRGLAALMVICGHVRGIMFVNGNDLAHPGRLTKALYFATSLGHQAVMIFFVLSGFLISGSVLKAYQEERWSWRWYLTNRLTRLYVVLIPALVLGAFLDRMGISCFGTRGIYGGRGGDFVVQVPVASHLTLKAFVGNALFLQKILVPTFGSNGPLWSLANEFWYYIVFALLLMTILGKGKTVRSAGLIGAMLIGIGMGIQMSLYFLIWLMGVAINFMPQIKRGMRALMTAALIAVLLALLASKYLNQTGSDFALGLASTVLIYALLQTTAPSVGKLFARMAHRLANMSYTLYVVHLPLIVFISAWILRSGRWNPDWFHLTLGLLVLMTGVLYAAAVAHFTEANTAAIRTRVAQWLDSLAPTQASAELAERRPAGATRAS